VSVDPQTDSEESFRASCSVVDLAIDGTRPFAMLSPIQFSKTDARGQSTGAGESSSSSQRCQEKTNAVFES